MTRRWRLGLGVAIVTLLVGATLAISLVVAGDDDDAADPRYSRPHVVRQAGGDEEAPQRADEADRRVTVAPSAPAVPLAEGVARSVEFDGRVTDLAAATLEITRTISVDGAVTDEAGAAKGTGTLTISSGRIRLAGRIDLQGRPLVITPTSARLTDYHVMLGGPIDVDADHLTFRREQKRGDPPQQEEALPGHHAAVRIPGDGKVTVTGFSDAVWHDPPADLALRGGNRTTLSWSGSGAVRGDTGTALAGQRLGVKAHAVVGQLHRDPGGMTLRADGELLQAYVDGLPRVPSAGRVDVKARPGVVAPGASGWFTWAPTNTSAFDMTIIRIHPANDQGRWVHLRLESLPSMCGGEGCPQVGGDTGELGRPQRRGLFGIGDDPDPINAVIIPHTGDERDISFTVPQGTPEGAYEIALVLEGNFDPITVRIPFEVRNPPPTTTR